MNKIIKANYGLQSNDPSAITILLG